jgi:hypothetical protein
MAYALVSKTSVLPDVRVRLPPPALIYLKALPEKISAVLATSKYFPEWQVPAFSFLNLPSEKFTALRLPQSLSSPPCH